MIFKTLPTQLISWSLIVLVTSGCTVPSAQPQVSLETYPEINSYLANGYTVLDTVGGDLNGDEYTDTIIALSKHSVDPAFTDAVRPLFILVGNAQGSKEVAAQNETVLLCEGCGGIFGDPYESIEIADGSFTIHHYGGSSWRWGISDTFSYDTEQKNWYLSEESSFSYHNTEPYETTAEEKTSTQKDFGIISFADFDRDEIRLSEDNSITLPAIVDGDGV